MERGLVRHSRGGGAGLTPGFPFHPRLAAGGTAGAEYVIRIRTRQPTARMRRG